MHARHWACALKTSHTRISMRRGKKLHLHYNARCPKCRRQAMRTFRLDWLGNVELRPDPSPLGETPVGEIIVVEDVSRRVFSGVYAIRRLCLGVPLYWIYGLLLYIPPIRWLVDRSKTGRNGEVCEV